MKYTRGNDILSALKYFYQNKYNVPTEVLAECRSIPEVICVAEKLQVPQNEQNKLGGMGIELLNNLGAFYSEKKEVREVPVKPAKIDKKPKRERNTEPKKEEVVVTEEANA